MTLQKNVKSRVFLDFQKNVKNVFSNYAVKHPVPDRVKPSFVIFDIRALWRSVMSVRVPGCQKLQMTT